MSRRARGLPPTPGVLAPSDRHYRRPDARPARRRRFGQWAWSVARLVVLVGAGATAAFWIGRSALGSGLLDVDRVVVRGNARLSAADVERLLAGMRGEHILRVNFDRYRRQVLESPWVADVTLWRLLPSTVEVTVVEREPLALGRLDDQLYLVDHDGVIIDGFGPAYADLNLPIVDGLMHAPAGHGDIVDANAIRVTARFLSALEARPAIARSVSEIDVTNPHDVVVLLDGDPVRLRLGDRDFVARLERYVELAPALRERFEGLDYVDLRFGERMPVGAAGRVNTGATTGGAGSD